MTIESYDQLADITCSVMKVKPESYKRNLERAHDADLNGCVCCGKGIKNMDRALRVEFSNGEPAEFVGPECAKRVKEAVKKD